MRVRELAVADAFAVLERDAAVQRDEACVAVLDDLEFFGFAVCADARFGDVDLSPGTAAAEEELLVS